MGQKKGKILRIILICLMIGSMFNRSMGIANATGERTYISVTDPSPWFTKGSNSGHPEYWYPHTYQGHDYISTYVGGMPGNPSQPDCWAKFKPYLAHSGKYKVYAYFYACKDTSTKVPFIVKYDGGSTTIRVNQYSSSPAWKEEYLGTWNFAAGESTYVMVTDATGEPYDGIKGLTIGAIKFVKVNQPPTCSLYANPRSGKAPLDVTFTISASDPDGRISAWVLDVNGDGNADYEGYGDPPSSLHHIYTDPGNYTAMLVVADNDGKYSDPATETIVVGENEPPRCSLSAYPRSGRAPLDVTFTMSASDSDGSISAWVLRVGDESPDYSGTGNPPSTQIHTYTTPGSYTAILMVSDDDGATASDIETINVEAAPQNQPPNTPSHPSPPDGAPNQSINLLLVWSGGDPDGDSVTYDVYFEADDSSPDDLICDDTSSTACDPGTLNYDTFYYWYVVATDEHGATTKGPVWNFTTGRAGLLPPPSLLSPSDGAVDVSIQPTFQWSSVSGANRYWLLVATDPSALPTDPYVSSCPGCVFEAYTSSTSYTHSSPLQPNTTYYWKVQGFNNSTTPITQGQYSATWSFTTRVTETLSVSLSANPSEGTAPLTTTLTADVAGTASGTINYTFWWDCNDPGTSVDEVMAICGSIPTPDLGTCVQNENGMKCNAVTDDPKTVNHVYSSAGTYTAKVIAERGSAPPAEDRTSIVVEPPQPCPSAPTLYSIDNPDCDGNYTVSWSSVSGATSYELQEDDNSSFSSPTRVYSGSSISWTASGKSPGTYYYRVRASTASCTTGWSTPRSVRVWPIPSTPTLYAISNPDGDGNYTVSWSLVSDATSYTLQEDDNPSFSSPTTVYSGSSTSKDISGRSAGTYYYRVRASNCRGDSSWSNSQSVTVEALPKTAAQLIREKEIDNIPITIDGQEYLIVTTSCRLDPEVLECVPGSGPTQVYVDKQRNPIEDPEIVRKANLIHFALQTRNELDLAAEIALMTEVQSQYRNLSKADMTLAAIGYLMSGGESVRKLIDEMRVIRNYEEVYGALSNLQKMKDLAKVSLPTFVEEGIKWIIDKTIWDPMDDMRDNLCFATSKAIENHKSAQQVLNEGDITNYEDAHDFVSSLQFAAVYQEQSLFLYNKLFKNFTNVLLRWEPLWELISWGLGEWGFAPKFVRLALEAKNAVDWTYEVDLNWIRTRGEDFCTLCYYFELPETAEYTLGLAGLSSADFPEFYDRYSLCIDNVVNKPLDDLIDYLDNSGEVILNALANTLSSWKDKLSSWTSAWLDRLASLTDKLSEIIGGILHSPGEFRLYDSRGRVTGSVNGEIREEIPNSAWLGGFIVVFSPSDSYRYQVRGTEEGLYGLEGNSVERADTIAFAVTDISITEDAVHEYTVDWDALFQDGSGITRQIDSDGDGTFEQTTEIQLPEASFVYLPENPLPGQTITFDASSSYDPDGEITSYKWDFGDGWSFESETGTVTHSYSSAGDYTVTLTVRDNDGAINTSTMTIEVSSFGYKVYLPFILKNR